MNTYLTYGIIFVTLLVLELVYFKIADKFNIIDKPFGKGLMVKGLMVKRLMVKRLMVKKYSNGKPTKKV